MIETVLGPIRADELGVTCMHDHLLSDSSRLQRPGAEPRPAHEEVRLDTLGYLRWNMLAFADNLRLDDPVLLSRELEEVRRLGQSALVECSSWGLGPNHAGLPAVARDSGVTVVSAYGAYVPRTLPAWIAEMSEAELEQHLFDALTVAIPGTDFRAGLLGIMGTTDEFSAREREMVRAAARAATRTGASVSVRLEPEVHRGLEVVETMVAAGIAADRIILTNADEYMDVDYWADLAATGAVLEMCFGTEAVHVGRIDNPSDRERLAFFSEFTARHPEARHVLGQSTWTKAQLTAFGGYGYGYLLARIVPELKARGLAESRITAMLVDEPRRLLDRPVVATGEGS